MVNGELTTALNGSLTLIRARAVHAKLSRVGRGSNMIGFFRKLLKDRRGNALMIAGACLPLVVGAAGLATDTIQWTLWKRQLQRAADSAAIAGVYDREVASGATTDTPRGGLPRPRRSTSTPWMSSAAEAAIRQVDLPGRQPACDDQPGRRSTLAVQQRLPFSSLFLSTAPIITATATAATVPPAATPACRRWRAARARPASTNSGNTTDQCADCIMYSEFAVVELGESRAASSSVTAKAIAAVGGIQQSNNWHVSDHTGPIRRRWRIRSRTCPTADDPSQHMHVHAQLSTTTERQHRLVNAD